MNTVVFVSVVDVADVRFEGVRNKVQGQIAAMERLGLDVYSFAFSGRDIVLTHRGEVTALDRFASSRYLGRGRLFAAVARWVAARATPVDACYLRYPQCDVFFYRLLAALKRLGTRVLLEIPSYPYDREQQGTRNAVSRLIFLQDRLLRTRLRPFVDRIVVTNSAEPAIFGIPTVALENGVDVRPIPLKTIVSHPGEVHLLSVAQMAPWHGFERVIAGLGAYYADRPAVAPAVYYHLVGAGGVLDEYRALVARWGLQQQVLFHGYLTGPALTAMFDQCDLAVSTLALHRNRLAFSSTLKAKEYCARGIPFVYAGHERVFAGAPFVLQVPSDDSPLDIPALLSFHRGLACSEAGIRAMRAFAETHCTWEKQFATLFGLPWGT